MCRNLLCACGRFDLDGGFFGATAVAVDLWSVGTYLFCVFLFSFDFFYFCFFGLLVLNVLRALAVFFLWFVRCGDIFEYLRSMSLLCFFDIV